MGWDDSDDEWDKNDDFDFAQPKAATGFSDEDVSEDEAPTQAAAITEAVAPKSNKPKKKTLKQIIAEKEATEREKEGERAAFRAAEEDDSDLTELEKKERLKQQVMQSDLENAQDLFGTTEITDDKDKEDFGAHPKTVAEFNAYAKLLSKHFNKLSGERPYQTFVEEFVRGIASDMSIDQVKSLNSVLTVTLNGKQQAQRAKDNKGKKKNKKPALRQAQNSVDDGSRYDDFDDFI